MRVGLCIGCGVSGMRSGVGAGVGRGVGCGVGRGVGLCVGWYVATPPKEGPQASRALIILITKKNDARDATTHEV